MILKVASLGRPILRRQAEAITVEALAGPRIQRLIDDMIATMHDYRGVGLAANQVHEGLRILVLEVYENPRYPRAPRIPLMALCNPRYEALGEEQHFDWEGCLSVPGLRGLVPRFTRIRVDALDREGRPMAFEADGFLARIIQHEVDHLDGRVYLDRMEDLQSLGFLDEIRSLHGTEASGAT